MSVFIVMGGVFVLIYFLMIRPQRRRVREQQDLLGSLEPGDDILTSSGIYGRISSFDGDSLFVDISDNTTIKITRASIAQKVVYNDATQNRNGADGAENDNATLPEENTEEEIAEDDN